MTEKQRPEEGAKGSFEMHFECPWCGEFNSVRVWQDDLEVWYRDKPLTQTLFTYLTADERELLITGICSNCWGKLDQAEDDR